MNPNCKKCMDSTSGSCIEHTEKDMIEEALEYNLPEPSYMDGIREDEAEFAMYG